MTRSIRTAAGYLVRFAILWFVDALSLLFTSWILPGVNLAAVTLANGTAAGPLTVAVAAALLLTIVNFLIRPVVFAVARPLGWIALFVVGFVVNAAALWLTAWLMPGFTVDLVGSLVGGIFLAFFNSIITGILDVGAGGLLVPEPHRTARPRRTLRRRRRDGPRPDAARDRRPQLLAHQAGDRPRPPPHPRQDDQRGRLRPLARRLRPALDDLLLPGRHHVWRERRHPRLPLVR